MQSRLESLIEVTLSTCIGYVVAILSQLVIFPAYGVETTMTTNMAIAGWFTVVSVLRSYVVRRWFNARLKTLSHRLAEAAHVAAK